MDDNLIWSAYDRISYYHTCKDLTTCPHMVDNICYCRNHLAVSPTRIIGCGFSKPSLTTKCYIGFGEQCSICLEPIVSKTNAHLTPCGHPFHRKCLIDNYQYREKHNMTLEFSNEIPCPVCRTGLVWCCVGFENLDKYNTENGLDKLENVLLSISIAPYLSCYKCNKGLGMNKSCNICECYRNNGTY
jgi:Ring finger domain